jgi:hypothetical protein
MTTPEAPPQFAAPAPPAPKAGGGQIPALSLTAFFVSAVMAVAVFLPWLAMSSPSAVPYNGQVQPSFVVPDTVTRTANGIDLGSGTSVLVGGIGFSPLILTALAVMFALGGFATRRAWPLLVSALVGVVAGCSVAPLLKSGLSSDAAASYLGFGRMPSNLQYGLVVYVTGCGLMAVVGVLALAKVQADARGSAV